MHKPNFFIVGAPKCGTTALVYYLTDHPDIFFSNPKEPNYFLPPDSQIRKIISKKHYIQLFKKVRNEKAVGESSVWYLYSEHACNEIAHFSPNARIIIMVRNPINFVASLHSQLLFSGIENEKSLKIAWEKRKNIDNLQLSKMSKQQIDERLLYGKLGMYSKYIKKYQKKFGKKNVHIILQEELKITPIKIYKNILDFLYVTYDNRTNFPIINSNKIHRSKLIRNILWISSKNNNLLSLSRKIKEITGVGSFGIYKYIKDINIKSTIRDKIENNLKNDMKNYFQDEIDRLSALIDKDLHAIWTL